MEQLIQRHNSMVARTPVQFRRYMYNKIDWSNRMIGLTGPRGVGKTTLVLQRIKQQLQGEKVLYVNMEDFYFTTHRFVDFAGQLSKLGYKYLFADEIHRYPDWSKELKLILLPGLVRGVHRFVGARHQKGRVGLESPCSNVPHARTVVQRIS